VIFCRGFIYETRFNKGSDSSDRYNMEVFHQARKDILYPSADIRGLTMSFP